ncbi:MAG: hypothetical protein CBB71_00690 [Rhodopirellula sp. TMED11]|nr:MAG: hypothetical protein CBB71_00690 [Rhodopirellula sp. TMED11]
MSNSHRLQAVRHQLRRWLAEAYAHETVAAPSRLQICAPPECEAAADGEAGPECEAGQDGEAVGQMQADREGEPEPVAQTLDTVSDEAPASDDQQLEDDPAPSAEQEAELEAKILSESILIREGFYAGRTFQLQTPQGSMQATWLMAPDELVVSDATGQILAIFQGPWDQEQDAEQQDVGTAATLPLHRPDSDESQADRDDDSSSTKAA